MTGLGAEGMDRFLIGLLKAWKAVVVDIVDCPEPSNGAIHLALVSMIAGTLPVATGGSHLVSTVHKTCGVYVHHVWDLNEQRRVRCCWSWPRCIQTCWFTTGGLNDTVQPVQSTLIVNPRKRGLAA